MKMYPALLSVTAGTYFFGFIQVGVLGVISAGRLHFAEFRLTSAAQIIGVLYAVRKSSQLILSINFSMHTLVARFELVSSLPLARCHDSNLKNPLS